MTEFKRMYEDIRRRDNALELLSCGVAKIAGRLCALAGTVKRDDLLLSAKLHAAEAGIMEAIELAIKKLEVTHEQRGE